MATNIYKNMYAYILFMQTGTFYSKVLLLVYVGVFPCKNIEIHHILLKAHIIALNAYTMI